MATKAKIRKDVLLRLLQEGHDPSDIRDNHWDKVAVRKNDKKPTRQAIYVHARKFVETGQIPSVPDGRGRGASIRHKVNSKAKAKTKGNGVMTPDKWLELGRDALQALAERPALLAELEKYKRGYSNALDELSATAKKEKKEKDWEREYRVAQQHGDINPPIGGLPGKAHMLSDIMLVAAPLNYEGELMADFTYHIQSALPVLVPLN